MKLDHETKTITISQNTGITFSVAFLLMVAGALISGAVWVANTQSHIDEVTRQVEVTRQDVEQLKSDTNDAKVKYAEIQTQLKSIDATLIEIKQAVRR